MKVFARDASCVRDLAGDARVTVATFDIRDGKEAKEGKGKEKKPGPPPSDRSTREIERDGLSPREIVIDVMLQWVWCECLGGAVRSNAIELVPTAAPREPRTQGHPEEGSHPHAHPPERCCRGGARRA